MKIDEENMPLSKPQRHLCWLKKKGRPCNGLPERKRKERESMEIFIQVLSRSLLGCFFFFCFVVSMFCQGPFAGREL